MALLVIIAATLSGGFKTVTDRSGLNSSSCTDTCINTRWAECLVLDSEITHQHLAAPWVITLTAIVILSMPTVLLRSRSKEKGLRSFACNLIQYLGLLSCAFLFVDHPSICFTLGLHSCVCLLTRLKVSDGLVGTGWWWNLRYLVILALLALEIISGPAISVVRWPSTPAGTALSCAYLAHLAGCIVPNLVMVHLSLLIATASYVHVHED